MKFRLLVFLLGLFALSACEGPYDPSTIAQNQHTLSSTKPDLVGTLSDGRQVLRYEISMGHENSHWVYFVGDTITLNRNTLVNKSQINDVTVIIDGRTFKLEESK